MTPAKSVSAVLTVLALAGCAAGAPAATPAHSAPPPAIMTDLQACQRLLADMNRNGGTPDRPTLDYIATHVSDARLSRDALSSEQVVGQSVAGILLGALAYDCRHTGVQIPLAG